MICADSPVSGFFCASSHMKGVYLMKVVILAGGFGTRISEESHLRPKPMISIGEQPILWHIMKYYSAFGFDEFIICAGYKQYVIKEYFSDYFLHNSDVTFDLSDNSMEVLNNNSEKWKVTIVDTGLHTMTGGRIKRIQKYVGNEAFMMTYGDGVSDINFDELVHFHEEKRQLATLTAVHVGQRFGVLDIDRSSKNITAFREKSQADGSRISAGFMVLEPEVFDYIDGDNTIFEKEPLERLVQEGQLNAYKHNGFWQCMDTQREKERLEEMWASGHAPWKVWD